MKNFLSFIFLSLGLSILSCHEFEPANSSANYPILDTLSIGENIVDDQYIFFFREGKFKPANLYEDLSRMKDRDSRAKKLLYYNELCRLEVMNWTRIVGLEEHEIIHVFTIAKIGISVKLSKERLNEFARNSDVEKIFRDRKVFIPEYSIKKVKNNLFGSRTQTIPCGIINTGGFGKNVNLNKLAWIIDTGIDKMHPDLNVNSIYSAHFNNTTSADDCDGHGTMIAGIIAAKYNDFGVVGVAPGAPVVSVRIFDCGGGGAPVSEGLKALEHVFKFSLSGDVLNLSWGKYFQGVGDCSNNTEFLPVINAIANNGVLVSIAAGNHNNYSSLYEPSCINGPNIYTVTNMTCDKQFSTAELSNFGIPPIDFIATGTDIVSTHPYSTYGMGSGTSFAAPHVTGILHLTGSSPIILGYVPHYGNTFPVVYYPIAGHH